MMRVQSKKKNTLFVRVWLFALVIATVILDTTNAQECLPDSGACDLHERCPAWREEGECSRNKAYMQKHCPASCHNVVETMDADSHNIILNCTDQHERCPKWAKLGECKANRKDMHKYCPKSCKVCKPEGAEDGDDDEDEDEVEQLTAVCKDEDDRCSSWAKSGECKNNPNYMLTNCAKSCDSCPKGPAARVDPEVEAVLDRSSKFGERQQANGEDRPRILKRIESTVEYMASKDVEDLVPKIRRECKNRHDLCTFWQVIGECEKNRAYMVTNCAAACHTCHLIDHAKRCPPLKDAIPALMPGDLNQMFERILREAPGNRTNLTDDDRRALQASNTPPYTVHVHSRPSEEPVTEVSLAQDKSLPPWVVTFENFLTEEECEALIQLGHKYGYKRSEDVGGQKFDGSFDSHQSSSRTSENAWCSSKEGCRDEEVAKRIHDRMSKVMTIPPENSEDLQLLRYEKGQFYKTHHDYIGHQKDRQCGPRILTFFLYLSDVEEGGGTNFPKLNITVMPKRGRALLWPSVVDSDPLNQDARTSHQALPVEKGVKFAANGWIHMYDYVGAMSRGCN